MCGNDLLEPLSIPDLDAASFGAQLVADQGCMGLDRSVLEGGKGCGGGHSIRGCVCFPAFFSSTGVG